MSDLTDNLFYLSAERIGLRIRLKNAGIYCDITLKIMVMLQNVFENFVRILEEDGAPSAPYVRYLVKKVKETGILSDKPKGEKPKTVRTPENIAALAEIVCKAPSTSIHRLSQQLKISDIIEANFA